MTDTVEQALATAAERLAEAGVEQPMGDARRLMISALELTSAGLTLHLKDTLSDAAADRFRRYIRARCQRKPVSQILGTREFWQRCFKVTPAVLDPRPDTETLIEQALSKPFGTVLDLGTGSGCILLTLLAETRGATGTGVDNSPEALKIAAENRAAFGLEDRAALIVSDWFSEVAGKFDLIVANPPYITSEEFKSLSPEVLGFEPKSALTPGPSGLESYREIALDIRRFLLPGGRVLLEIGPTQAGDVITLFECAGLELVRVHADMDGRDRVVELRHPG